jgi:hypothetical protein
MTTCSHPIRLRGWHERIDADTGELLSRVVTAREPGGVLLVACGDRRAASCPSCAETYRHDAFQLVAAGVRGGKGVPEAVGEHPAVMVTLTAPSFGAVHTIRDRDGGCPCGCRHLADDEALGAPVDPDRYRYLEQATWNHLVPVLWKRTVQELRRTLARELGVARHRLGGVVRVRFVKASEFQRRGVVHYHAVIRLDGPGDVGSEPPSRCTAELLERVIRCAAETVDVSAGGLRICWGRQLDVVPLAQDDIGRAAGYIAKYATKATEVAANGLLVPRLHTAHDVAKLEAPAHAKRLVGAAWLGGGERGLRGARGGARQFGYGGHTLTKSHDYSVTLAVLRGARAAWRSGRPADAIGDVITRGRLSYAGRGPALWSSGEDGRNLELVGRSRS